MKPCANCQVPFSPTAAEALFRQKISPRFQNVLFPIPEPALCPPCRMQRRMAHRNQIYVNLRPNSDGDGKFFSMYFGETAFPVLPNQAWWDEEGWDPLEFGVEFDFSRPFFEQWRELRDRVPRPALNTVSGTIENSDYCNNAAWIKNCYFCFDVDRSRDCLYAENLADCTDCMDCTAVVQCELCYDCTACTNCYSLQSSADCLDCSASWFLSNCRSCTNCFGCVNLRHKKFCIYNRQVSEAEFQAFLSSTALSSWSVRTEIAAKFAELCRADPRPHLVGARAEGCTGNHIFNSREVVNGYFIHDAEDVCHCDIMKTGGKSCYDCTISFLAPELMYECTICGLNVFNLLFCYNCWDGASDLLYCDTSHGAKHCFGCVCLRRRSHCIFNRQYTEDEYSALVPKIIEHMRETGEWGENFPMEHSPWPYNLSLASRYFPIGEEEAVGKGLRWQPLDSTAAAGELVCAVPDGLPVSDDPFVTRCAETGRRFRVTAEELKRLRRFDAPVPRKSYDRRMSERALRCGGLKLFSRRCDRSGADLETVYADYLAATVWRKDVFDKEFS